MCVLLAIAVGVTETVVVRDGGFPRAGARRDRLGVGVPRAVRVDRRRDPRAARGLRPAGRARRARGPRSAGPRARLEERARSRVRVDPQRLRRARLRHGQGAASRPSATASRSTSGCSTGCSIGRSRSTRSSSAGGSSCGWSRTKREQNALALIDQCRRLSPSFAIPPEAAALSDYARAIGRPRLADELAAAAPRADVSPRARSP